MGKLAFLFKWSIIEKKSYKRHINDLHDEDYTTMHIIIEISKNHRIY